MRVRACVHVSKYMLHGWVRGESASVDAWMWRRRAWKGECGGTNRPVNVCLFVGGKYVQLVTVCLKREYG